MTRFDVKNDENIENENVADKIDKINKIFDFDADFELANKIVIDSEKTVDSDDVKSETEKINELEITNFDFFV